MIDPRFAPYAALLLRVSLGLLFLAHGLYMKILTFGLAGTMGFFGSLGYPPVLGAVVALASGSVEAWVAWDPFLSAAEQQTGARVLRDGTGLSQYKRYYLAGADYATQRTDVLALLFGKLRETGAWVKANPDAAAARLGALWKLDPAIVRQANARRSYQVEPVTRPALAEQQTIADAFRAEGLLPRAVDAAALPIWAPPGL